MLMLGTDPELVGVAASEQHLAKLHIDAAMLGKPIPGYFALPVANPKEPDITIPFGKLRPDGMALEFTVEPTNSVSEMVHRLRANLHATAELALATSGAVLSVEPRFWTDQYWIDLLPESYGDACSLQVLGCAPDFNVYNMDIPAKPDPKRYNWRTSGGHIHMEVGQSVVDDPAAVGYITAALDAIIGTAATYLCTSTQAYLRKELYGQSGMVRINDRFPILEYRTLPAQALIQTPELAEMMFTAAQNVATWMVECYQSMRQLDAIATFRHIFGDYANLVRVADVINRHDVDACRQAQSSIVQTAPDDMNIHHSIKNLQHYTMPDGFSLYNWGF